MSFTYGPVPSRRLGRSLGVSVIPHKACSYSCIYCQLGRTLKPRVRRARFFDRRPILDEITARATRDHPDFVTFVGDGEPTLSMDLGWLIEQTKTRLHLPTAVITNGSLLWRKEVRRELDQSDVVMPSLDAGDERTFQAINRPHPSLSFEQVASGLIAFRKGYNGRIWLETMLVRGLNDDDRSLRRIRRVIDRISPDRVDITAPVRPPAESAVAVPQADRLKRAAEILRAQTVAAFDEYGEFGVEPGESVRDAIIRLTSRHPLRWEQAMAIERMLESRGAVRQLISAGTLKRIRYRGRLYVTT